MKKIINFLKANDILSIFLFFVVVLVALGLLYCYFLSSSDKKIEKIIKKFTVDQYSIPYYVAERYLTWYGMRTFFYMLDYSLTLLGIVASLMTVFYAATDGESSKKNIIVFLSLLSLTFTVANIFVNARTLANMSQYAWRQLDTCIMETIHKSNISANEKNVIIVGKVVEMEQYIESFEH